MKASQKRDRETRRAESQPCRLTAYDINYLKFENQNWVASSGGLSGFDDGQKISLIYYNNYY